MTDTSNDLTVVYYSAEMLPEAFRTHVGNRMLESLNIFPAPIVYVTRRAAQLHDIKNIFERELPYSHFSIYRQALEGAKMAQTKWIALCEDDELYSPEHFKYRPKNKPFAYNLAYWGLYTWQDPPMYNYKGRKNLGNLICDRVAFIEAMEERFQKYPTPSDSLKDIWAEPGKYERQLGVTVRETEDFYSQPPNIKFSHQTELSFAGLGTRKRSGELRAYDIPHWGRAEEIRKMYQ